MRNVSIRNKLLAAFGLITLLAGTAGFLAVAINAKIELDVAQIRQAATEKAEAVSEMAESLLQLQIYEQMLKTEKKETAGEPRSSKISKITAGTVETTNRFEAALVLSRRFGQEAIEVARHEGATDEILHSEQDNALLDKLATQFDQLKKAIQNQLTDTMVHAEGNEIEFAQVSALVEKFESDTKRHLENEVEGIQKALGNANAILLSFAVVMLFVCSALTWYISRTVSYPIGLLKTFAEGIGRGDLDKRLDLESKDEFGILASTFNKMADDLRSKTVSKDYVDGILKSMVNTVIVVLPDCTVKSANNSTLELLGYSMSELLGQSMDGILEPSSGRSQALLAEAFQTGSVSNVDVFYLSRSGVAIPMTFSAATLRDSLGAVSGLVCVAQDCSERKVAERALEEANKQLLETSRQAGMAEVATSVLHNVGNVLNSVNVSSALISEKVQNSKIANFGKAVALIEAHQTDLPAFFAHDAKGKQLPGYLNKLAVNLQREQTDILREVALLATNILHIKDIVATQQNYARVSGVAEALNVADLVDDALRINAGAMERHRVKVLREYEEIPPVLIEKHKMLQVLVNLIGNAKYACQASERENKEVTLRVVLDRNRVKISVIDNGIGICEENVTRIFGYGFTTKKDGHGFGLHSSALAAKEMGGTLTVSSEGLGSGANFTLEIPSAKGAYEN